MFKLKNLICIPFVITLTLVWILLVAILSLPGFVVVADNSAEQDVIQEIELTLVESEDDLNQQTISSSTQEILDWVINCESGGRMSAIGAAGEVGILQYMPLSFAYLSNRYGFEGNICNEQDQTDLFLIALEKQEAASHWVCYNKWLNR